MIPSASRFNMLVWGALASIPAAVTLILLHLYLQVNVSQFMPDFYRVYNDSFFYWRQAYTFSAVGFDGGYYTLDELPAPAGFSRFYAHGPGYAVIYGLIGRVFGWHLPCPVWINLGLITLTLGGLLVALRTPFPYRLLLLGVVLFVWPVLLYVPTGMSESLHHAGAVLIAYPLWRLITERNRLPKRVFAALLIILTILTLTRPTWSVLFIPCIVLYLRTWSFRNLSVGLVLACVVIVLLNMAQNAIAAPYPLPDPPANADHGLQGLIEARLDRLNLNLANWTKGIDIEVAQRYAFVGLLGGILFLWLFRRKPFSVEAVFHLCNLGLPLAINLFLNDMAFYRDFRALAPHLLLSLLILVACRRWILPAVFITVQVIMLPNFLTEYRATVEHQFTKTGLSASMDAFRTQVAETLVYQPDAPSPWCNTLLFIMENWNDQAMGIPPELTFVNPGIGLSYYVGYWDGEPTIDFPLKSRYILLTDSNRERIGNRARLTVLTETVAGKLYRNEDVQCGSQS
jgi:hypothetical protein